MQKRINGLLKVFCCGSMREAKKGSSSEQPLVLSTSVSGSQDTVFETSENKTNLSDKDKNSAWLSQKKWHEVQRGLRQTPSISHQDLTTNGDDYVAVDRVEENQRAPSCPERYANSPPVPDRSLKPKINSSTHTPNSPISPPGTTGSQCSPNGNDKFFPDYPLIINKPFSVNNTSDQPTTCAYVKVNGEATSDLHRSQKQSRGSN
ncbi:Oidioi.mRNA.OKI2018_I69.XSR.g14443.t1.cds [Oikopleura dioica]|uniref:Oidioi.mRNA.OKI2018_I69.XSR.g14443.t1.cds n=1 Tax=Oikopleura dioica TaxID=34765 RepID=A0ABN7SH37_OIKDI|nr:Oidioi.mRNA.OKI2018_I69.XSR.g14443.t1.cds [Oikopleura dioica]